MKTTISIIILAILVFAGSFFCSCLSSDQKKNATSTQLAADNEKKNTAVANCKVATCEELKRFRLQSELKIKNNEAVIAKLKLRMAKSTIEQNEVYAQKIDPVEIKNKNLKTRLTNYEKIHVDWRKFKRDFNRDSDELGNKLKNLAINNK